MTTEPNTSMTSGLSALLAQAHPVVTLEDTPNLRLAALAPDAVSLAIRQDEWITAVIKQLRSIEEYTGPGAATHFANGGDALHAEFEALNKRAET